MSQSQAHKDIMAALERAVADHAAYPLLVESDNRKVVDHAQQDRPYLKVEIKFFDAEQIELGEKNVRVEQWGQLWLTAACKAGTGALASRELLDFITPYFERKRLGIVTCRAVSGGNSSKEIKGEWCTSAVVTFYYHRLS